MTEVKISVCGISYLLPEIPTNPEKNMTDIKKEIQSTQAPVKDTFFNGKFLLELGECFEDGTKESLIIKPTFPEIIACRQRKEGGVKYWLFHTNITFALKKEKIFKSLGGQQGETQEFIIQNDGARLSVDLINLCEIAYWEPNVTPEVFRFEEKDYFEVLSKFFLFNTGTFSGPELLETLRKYAIKD
jgi:hypothetical protein